MDAYEDAYEDACKKAAPTPVMTFEKQVDYVRTLVVDKCPRGAVIIVNDSVGLRDDLHGKHHAVAYRVEYDGDWVGGWIGPLGADASSAHIHNWKRAVGDVVARSTDDLLLRWARRNGPT